MNGSGVGRRVRHGGVSIMASVLFVGVLVLLYGLTSREEIAFDLTETQRYSLSNASREALAGMDIPIHIVGFYSSASLDARDSATTLLRQYQQVTNGLVTFEFIDPDQQPTMAAAYGVTRDRVLFAARPDDPPQNAEQILSADERQITQAILKLLKSGDFKVYFVTGHGERAVDDGDVGGLSLARQTLDLNTIAAESLNLLAADEVPADASAVVIAGATRHFAQEEVDILAAYLDDGGRLMILADPPLALERDNFMDDDDPLAAYLSEHFGVRFRNDVVVSQFSFRQVFEPISDRVAGNHPITQGLQQQPVVFFVARTVEALPEAPEGVFTTNLVFSADGDYAEKDIAGLLQNPPVYANDPDVDTQSPLALAASVQRNIGADDEARIVLVGDSDFATNSAWSLQGNQLFFLNSIDWLTEFSAELTVEVVSDLTQLPVFASAQQQNTIALVTILLMPFSVLAVGAVVWWSRRRR